MGQEYPISQSIKGVSMVRSVFRILGKEFLRNEIPLRSAGVSYFLFFALIPIVTTLVSVIMMLPFLKVEAEQVFMLLTNKLLPEAMYEVKSYFVAFSENARVVCIASLVVSTWLLSKIVFFFEESLNYFWRLETKRSPIRLAKKALLLYFLAILGIGASTALPDLGKANVIADVIITWTLFVGFNRIVPAWPKDSKNHVPLKALLPGSLLCGSVWYISKWGFTIYMQRFAKLEHILTILGILPVFLLWLYFSSYMLMMSASLNSAKWFYSGRSIKFPSLRRKFKAFDAV